MPVIGVSKTTTAMSRLLSLWELVPGRKPGWAWNVPVWSVDVPVYTSSKVTWTAGVARKPQCAAVRKTCGETSVPEQ